MRPSRLTLVALTAVCSASFALITSRSLVLAAPGPISSQAPATNPPAPEPHHHPNPTNLKVLPKNLTGDQVDEIMEQWEGELGTGCKTCHAADPKNIGPNGKPRLNFADDSKEEKQTARLMYQMVEKINADYVAKIDSSGAPVTCGTCHRGHLGPEPFVPAKKEEKPH